MVLFGRASHGRWPSPSPRCTSANTVTCMARWLPSGCGMAPTPMKAPGLMSAMVALLTPNTAASPVRLTFTSPSFSDLIASTLPSKLSTVPLTRIAGGCCAQALPSTTANITAASAMCFNIGFSLHCRLYAATDVNDLRKIRVVRLFERGHDDDLSAGLKLAFVGRPCLGKHCCRRDNNFLLAALVFYHQGTPVGAGNRRFQIGICHGAARLRIPRPLTFAVAARSGEQNMDRKSFDAAIRPRHAGNADIRIVLDIGERCFRQRRQAHVVSDLDHDHLAVIRFHRQHRAVGFLDLTADAAWLLRKHGGGRKTDNDSRGAKRARHIQ